MENLPATMSAAVVEAPGKLVLRRVPIPAVGEYDALCEMAFGATCTGTDLHLIDGVFPWPPVYPAILGHESVGRVVRTGSKVRNFKAGDLVTRVGCPPLPREGLDVCWGGFVEYGIARDHWQMRKDGLPSGAWNGYRVNQVVPPEVDPAAATMLITWRETFSYISRMGLAGGAALLVVGSGGNGLSLMQHAANLGAQPRGMVGSQSRRAAALRAGAEFYLDFRSPTWKQEAAAICPQGFDFVIDALGRKESAQAALEQVRRGGGFGVYGVDDIGQPLLDPFKARGPFRWTPNEYDEAEAHSAVVDFLLSGKLDASLWMDLQHPLPLEQIAEAYTRLRRKEHIKVLIQLKSG